MSGVKLRKKYLHTAVLRQIDFVKIAGSRVALVQASSSIVPDSREAPFWS